VTRPHLLFSHNYPMAEARRGWKLGVYPGAHLYGTSELESVADVVDLPYRDRRDGGRLRVWLRLRFGDLGQQWRMLRRMPFHRDDIWYSGEYRTVNTLMLLRRLHLGRRPIIVVAHEGPLGRLDRRCLPGADIILCNSKQVAQEMIGSGIDPRRVRCVPWGVDLEFEGYRSLGSEYVLSIGKSARDQETLLRALEQVQCPARVYAERPLALAWAARLPQVVFREPTPGHVPRPGALTYEHVLEDLQRAAVFAIPLDRPHRSFGLTELNDALGLGKPVIMTRTPYIDCDIEAVGCGIWVDEGDVDGWAAALERLMSSPRLRDQMGRRGREFAEREWNMGRFENALRDAVREVSASSDHLG